MRQDHGANSLLLFATVSLALGLATVTAGIAPFGDEPRDLLPHRPRGLGARAVAVVVTNRVAGDGPSLSLTSGWELPRASGPVALPSGRAGGPWTSPLYPQNGVTLWDRIRVSTARDRPAFLLGTGIQVHAPQIAATPGPPRALPLRRPARAAEFFTAGRGTPTTIAHVGTSPSGPWVSPLSADGEALWDRLRLSPSHDRRAFLLATAIQLHAPQVAAPRVPDIVLPSKEG